MLACWSKKFVLCIAALTACVVVCAPAALAVNPELARYTPRGQEQIKKLTSRTSSRLALVSVPKGHLFYDVYAGDVELLALDGSVTKIKNVTLAEAAELYPANFPQTDGEGFPIDLKLDSVATILQHALLRENFVNSRRVHESGVTGGGQSEAASRNARAQLWDARFRTQYSVIWGKLLHDERPLDLDPYEARLLRSPTTTGNPILHAADSTSRRRDTRRIVIPI